jgi:hypothetical protein
VARASRPCSRRQHRRHCFSTIAILILLSGCQAPLAGLTFPARPLVASSQPQWFDVTRDGRPDFAVTFDDHQHLDALLYDDDQDGRADRVYHTRDYSADAVPHLVILLDSIPFRCVAERYAAGQFRWFDGPPVKVIPPFPSLTEVCYTELLRAPPMPGVIDRYWDAKTQRIHPGLWDRAVRGDAFPWERRLHYRMSFVDEAFAYLDPRPWFAAELERARRAFDASPDRTTLVYLTSASGMACKYGRAGIDEVLDGAAQLCLQVLYERRGAVKISLLADHGHNLVPSKNVRVDALLARAGFHVGQRLREPDDVVLEVNGLVTYAGVRTKQPSRVADALLREPAVDMAMYLAGDRVIVRTPAGAAAVDARGPDRIRYAIDTADVLGYAGVVDDLRRGGKLDAEGFASRDDWFAATADHEYPDAPPRIWDAFHGLVVSPPDVMFTTSDGSTAGLPSFERFIAIRSTHGSLNQINSATFLLTMTGRLPTTRPLRTREVMPMIATSWAARNGNVGDRP